MHFRTTYCVVILLASYVSSEEPDKDGKVSYNGAQVWRATINDTKHVHEIQKLIAKDEIDVWNIKPTHVDFLVRAPDKVHVDRRLRALDMNHTILVANVQKKLESQYATPPMWTEDTLRLGHRLDFNYYPDLTVIDEYLKYVKDQYKSICTLKTIGRSEENRPIQMAVVSNGNPKNQAILLNSGSHAREWIAITSALYVLNDLVARFDNQPDYIKNLDWYIIPVQNPDGYVYSHSTDRLWRKNRRSNKGSSCAGVDLNRNYGMHWSVSGVSDTNPCSNIYGGPSAFSEPETRVIQTLLNSKKIAALVDLHSYGQDLLYPWSGVSKETPHEQMLRTTGSAMKEAIFKASQKSYRVGNVFHSLYPASGSMMDFSYSKGVHNMFAIEMRDTGRYGFLLPVDQIVDCGVEIKEAIYSMAKTLHPQFRSDDSNKWF